MFSQTPVQDVIQELDMVDGRCLHPLADVARGRWISPAVQALLSLGAPELSWEDVVLVEVIFHVPCLSESAFLQRVAPADTRLLHPLPFRMECPCRLRLVIADFHPVMLTAAGKGASGRDHQRRAYQI